MHYESVTQIYFSPTGTTKKVVEELGRHVAKDCNRRDLLRSPAAGVGTLTADTVTIVGVPVYNGRIPPICRDMLEKLKGLNTPAIAVVVYGNRAYEDALLELTDVLKHNGFLVVGAGAFVAQHSIFPRVGKARPDAADKARIVEFAGQCAAKLERMNGDEASVTPRGNIPYREPGSVPLKPSANKRCTACGACAALCPTGAISKESPPVKDSALCISCAACIAACPEHAQAFRGVAYTLFGVLFGHKCRIRQEPEWFV